MGTSTVSSLLAGKKFNYVAMGTIFVATVPLNGFLLQNTISFESSTCSNSTNLNLTLAPRLPLGFSADMKNGEVGPSSDPLVKATSSWNGLSRLPAGVFYPYVNYTSDNYFETIGCANKNQTAVCKSKVTVVGFDMSCTTSPDKDYDLTPNSHPKGTTYRTTVFSSKVTWNESAPNLISLDIMYKPNQTCQGRFYKKSCQLTPAVMSLPIQVNSDTGFYAGTELANSENAQPVITLDPSANLSDFKVLEKIPVYENEGKTNSTYGGIAKWLAQRYDGSIDWVSDNGTWSANTSGLLTGNYELLKGLYKYDNKSFNITELESTSERFNPSHSNDSWCENVYSGQDWVSDSSFEPDTQAIYASGPAQEAQYALHQLMLGASVSQASSQWDKAWDEYNNAWDQWYVGYQASNYSDKYPSLPETADTFYERLFGDDMLLSTTHANQTQPCLRYSMKYQYWGASVAITVSIVLMVAPLFYGFWTLDRRGTLSPFETAYAFGAPALQDADMKKGTGILLKEIGKRPAVVKDHTPSISSPSQTTTKHD